MSALIEAGEDVRRPDLAEQRLAHDPHRPSWTPARSSTCCRRTPRPGKVEIPADLETAREGLLVFPAADDRGWTVAVLGMGLSGELVRFAVRDVAMAARYRPVLLEVSDEASRMRPDLSGRRLEIAVVRWG